MAAARYRRAAPETKSTKGPVGFEAVKSNQKPKYDLSRVKYDPISGKNGIVDAVLRFGKYRDKSVAEIVKSDPGYLRRFIENPRWNAPEELRNLSKLIREEHRKKICQEISKNADEVVEEKVARPSLIFGPIK